VDENLQSALEDHLASMNPSDWAALVARVRPPTDPASARATIGAKCSQLWQVTQQCGENGYTAGISDAAAARAPHPAPQPEPPAAPTGFGVNRAQGQSGDGTPPAPVQQQRLSNQPRIYPGGAL
jgi:hypothetical protein